MSEPDSLCARILRAKYYPDGNLLDAKPKQGSSYTWQSVLAGLECFMKGYIWRVGDGSKIDIWEDKWITSSPNLKVQTMRRRNIITNVQELIDPMTGQWDYDLVRSIFSSVDAQRILQILLTNGREDLVAWHFNKNGLFSVKSAYHCQWSSKFEENGDRAQDADGRRLVWKNLWKADVPGKIKIHGCRILHDHIPCRAVLVRKHIMEDSSCPFCPSDQEDTKHMMFTCNRAQAVWRAMGIGTDIELLSENFQSASDILASVVRRGGPVQGLNVGLTELILTGGWYIWWERRRFTHGEQIQSPHRSAMSIIALTMNYKLSNKKAAKIRQGWARPAEGYLSVNTDAAFDERSHGGSTGVVIRDNHGDVIAASNRVLPYVVDAHMAEVWALRDGLILAQNIGASNLVFQTDCLEVVTTIQEGGFSGSAVAAIYDECMGMWQDLTETSIIHIDREANMVAHGLARHAFISNTSCTWLDETPDFIRGDVARDVTILHDQ